MLVAVNIEPPLVVLKVLLLLPLLLPLPLPLLFVATVIGGV
jgi:hypothetical protein